jgi:hypothetical protein
VKRDETSAVSDAVRHSLLQDTRVIFSKIISRKDSRLKFDYETSVKAFQLSNPDLQRWGHQHEAGFMLPFF